MISHQRRERETFKDIIREMTLRPMPSHDYVRLKPATYSVTNLVIFPIATVVATISLPFKPWGYLDLAE